MPIEPSLPFKATPVEPSAPLTPIEPSLPSAPFLPGPPIVNSLFNANVTLWASLVI
ncbi:hypothetical protein COI_2044 [Mannheimia haemolytica serotype A2 str. OVINE]|nr:hypothetical protein COI_2044 [Mannheimia haemolytica serotype A2 str. OVINE]EEY13386.1 hypothetical protein COK_0527 [Mannheimia haemolytica serotype A2 str. BOVINE]